MEESQFQNLSLRIKHTPASLTRRYVLALSLIALLTVVGQILMQYSFSTQDLDSNTINLAGRQRMLCTAISKDALAVLAAPDPSIRRQALTKLRDHLGVWVRTHEGLLKGDRELRLSGRNSPEIMRLFDRLESSRSEVVAQAEALLASADRDPSDHATPRRVMRLLRVSDEAISWIDRIVGRYALEARQRLNRAKTISVILAATILLVLCLEVLVIFRPAVGTLSRYISELAASTEQMHELSIRDGLTGLYNRRYFDQLLAAEWQRAVREKQPLSLIMFDVDYFKLFNDTYGHQAGDEVLARIAGTARDTLRRPADVVARYGGEEFIALLPGTDLGGAAFLAEKVRAEVETLAIEHPSSRAAPMVTVSLGVAAIRPTPEDRSSQLLRQVDEAMYEAKRRGRNRVDTAPSS
ncbi:MAG: diguanylate cyclase [Proteobacteria bacterium]|nr:diguanylate cyclase [Pseudomonadota bacterium]